MVVTEFVLFILRRFATKCFLVFFEVVNPFVVPLRSPLVDS